MRAAVEEAGYAFDEAVGIRHGDAVGGEGVRHGDGVGHGDGVSMATLDDPRPQVELAVEGMTCASCAARIEKRLNRLDGVTATVNYATERARVAYPAGLDPRKLVEAVEAAGYTAALPPLVAAASGAAGDRERSATRGR